MLGRRRSAALGILAALAAAGVGSLALLGGRGLSGEREGASSRRAARSAPAGEPSAGGAEERAPALAAAGDAPARARAAAPAPPAGIAVEGEPDPLAPELSSAAPWSGRVLAAGTDAPLAGARVVLQHAALEVVAETDAAGAFALAWPAGLPAELALMHPDGVDRRLAEQRLEPDAVYRLELSARIRGAVQGWPPPGLAAGAEPEALLWPRDAPRRDGEEFRSAPLDAQGRFGFEDVEPGAWNLAVCAPGASIEERGGLELRPGETLDVALPARAGGVLRGRVQDRASGAPIGGVEVVVQGLRSALPDEALPRFARDARTDAGGAFEVAGLAAGPLRVDVRLPWGADVRAGATIPETLDPAELVVLVASPGRLQGRVVDAAGGAAAGALVLALPRGERDRIERALETGGGPGEPGEARATADASGAFALPAVPAEEALVLLAFPAGTAGAPGDGPGPGPPGSTTLSPLAAGGSLDGVLVRLPAAASVAGRVLGLDGRPPPAATVELGPLVGGASAPRLATATDPEGFFRCEGVPAGAVLVEADAPGYRPQRLRVDVPPAGAQDVRIELVPSFAVEGRVLDEEGGGRSGINVRLELDPESPEGAAQAQAGGKTQRVSAFTDAYGRFRLEPGGRGRWLPSIRSGDWELARATPPVLEVPGDAGLVLDLRRIAREELASVSGEVWARDGGEVLDVRVHGLGRGSVLTTAGHSFLARGVEPGPKKLVIGAQGCVPERRGPLEILPGAEHDLGRIELERGTRLDVRVHDAAGKPVDGARVVLRPLPQGKGGATAGAWNWRLERRDRGLYSAEAAPRGRWRLQVARDGMKTRDELITVEEKPSEVVVRLDRP